MTPIDIALALEALQKEWRNTRFGEAYKDTAEWCASDLQPLIDSIRSGAELAELERELAEEAAEGGIASFGVYWPDQKPGKGWYSEPQHIQDGWYSDPQHIQDHVEEWQRCVRYLDLRGLLERHPEHPEWVRVREG